MKSNPLALVRLLHKSKYLFLAIAVGLISLHLYSVWKISFHLDAELDRNTGSEFLSISLLFWGAALSLLWQKHRTLKLDSKVFSSFMGVSIITLVIFKSISLSGDDSFLRISPLLSALGLGLLASGIKELKQYWREFLLLLVLALPIEELLAKLVDLATLTAQFASFLLSQLGFEVERHNTIIALPTGAVDVNQGCSGLRGMTRLLQLSVLILVMIPTKLSGKIIVPAMAILLAFVVNGVRVAVLELLIAYSNRKAFDYWHEGAGSHTISMVSVIVLWLFCQYVIRKDEPEVV